MRRWLILLLPAVVVIALLWESGLQHWLPQPPQGRPAACDHLGDILAFVNPFYVRPFFHDLFLVL